jgi:hypothetical protein
MTYALRSVLSGFLRKWGNPYFIQKSRKRRTMKKLINKILHLFGYHLTKMPRPYQRKKKGGQDGPEKP